MTSDALAEFNETVFIMLFVFFKYGSNVIDHYHLVLIKELKDVVIVIIECVAVYLGQTAELSDRYAGELLGLKKFLKRFE